jgi:hypothetical protein
MRPSPISLTSYEVTNVFAPIMGTFWVVYSSAQMRVLGRIEVIRHAQKMMTSVLTVPSETASRFYNTRRI